MEIELFKVYQLNDYGKKVFETDKIFVAQNASIKNWFVVIHENKEGDLVKLSVADFLIKQVAK